MAKKLITVFVFMIFTLSACSDKGNESVPSTNEENPTVQEAPTVAQPTPEPDTIEEPILLNEGANEMDLFYGALISEGKSDLIPEEFNYWGGLVGSWEIDFISAGDPETIIPGEWHWSWILDGTSMLDVFIVPSRAAIAESPEMAALAAQGGEYGGQIRFFNTNTNTWTMLYGHSGYTRFLESEIPPDGNPVARVIPYENEPWTIGEKWTFVEITADTFHWQNVHDSEDGTRRVNADVYGRRIR